MLKDGAGISSSLVAVSQLVPGLAPGSAGPITGYARIQPPFSLLPSSLDRVLAIE